MQQILQGVLPKKCTVENLMKKYALSYIIGQMLGVTALVAFLIPEYRAKSCLIRFGLTGC
jgi:hypothetical protein